MKNKFPIRKITDINRSNIIHQINWGNKDKMWYKRFQDYSLPRRKLVQHQHVRNVVTTWFTTNWCKKRTCWYDWTVNMYNQGDCKINLPYSTIQFIQNFNDNITIIGSCGLPLHDQIQRQSVWYSKSIIISGRNSKDGYGIEKYSHWFMCDGSHW